MAQANFFFSVFLFVLVVVRVALFYKPIQLPKIKGRDLHPYMFGIVIIILGAVLEHVTLYGLGFALFVEELPWLMLRRKNRVDGYAPKASLILLGLILVIFLFRNTIVFF